MRSPGTGAPAHRTPTSSSRCCAAWATTSRPPSRPGASGSERTARSATWWRAWRTWCAGSWRTRPTSRSWASRPGAPRSRSSWRRRDRPAAVRQRAGPGAAPGARTGGAGGGPGGARRAPAPPGADPDRRRPRPGRGADLHGPRTPGARGGGGGRGGRRRRGHRRGRRGRRGPRLEPAPGRRAGGGAGARGGAGAAVALLPGAGEVGAALVRHPGVHTIAFTGSAAVGLEIVEAAAHTPPGQRHVKRVVAEMGGKNCVIVDADADLDEAVPGIASSAFAYAGQKCSAASRVLVHEAIHDSLVERLAGAVEVLVVGQAQELGTEVPPLIERAAQQRVLGYRKRTGREGRVLARGPDAPAEGWFVSPTLVGDVPPESPVLREEVFGPLLTVEPVADVEAALPVLDGLPFALPGGLFDRDPATVERVVAAAPVGNLYVNRAITGAKVGRQPFGGRRLSGTGAQAGGPDYLLQFVDSETITENTVRHGLAV